MLAAVIFLKMMAYSHPTEEWGLAQYPDHYVQFEGGPYSVRIDCDACLFIGHTHDDYGSPRPSEEDIAIAKRTGIPDLVVSKYHVYLIEGDGKVDQIQ